MRALGSMIYYLIIAMTCILNSPVPPPPLPPSPAKVISSRKTKYFLGDDRRQGAEARPCARSLPLDCSWGTWTISLSQIMELFLIGSAWVWFPVWCWERTCGFPLQISIFYVNLLMHLRWVTSASVSLERKGLITTQRFLSGLTCLHYKTSVFHAPVLQTVNR